MNKNNKENILFSLFQADNEMKDIKKEVKSIYNMLKFNKNISPVVHLDLTKRMKEVLERLDEFDIKGEQYEQLKSYKL